MAERYGIGRASFHGEASRNQWIQHHRDQGHEPYAAPTRTNAGQWECKCDPDAPWTAVWRILTIEEVKLKYTHLSKPIREAQRRGLPAHIAEIQSEQEERNDALHKIDHSHIAPLRIAVRYAAGRSRSSQCGESGGD